VRGFSPSLYLNLGKSYEDLGDLELARRYCEPAAARTGDLSGDGYGPLVRSGIAAGLARVS
jgi:hypothetical protein